MKDAMEKMRKEMYLVIEEKFLIKINEEARAQYDRNRERALREA
jgi:hypothetical protein